MKSVLLTRSADENRLLAAQLNKYSFNLVHCPLIEYKDLPLDNSILNNYSHFIVTSKYAAKLIAAKTYKDADKVKNIWTVGKKAAAILAEAGFMVKYVASNVEELVRNLPAEIYSQSVYLSSNEITLPMPMPIKRQIIYEVFYRHSLTSEDVIAINQGLDHILLYSINNTQTLIELLIKYKLLAKLKKAKIIAISLKVANIAKQYFVDVIYSEQSCTQTQMIKLLLKSAGFKD